MGLIEELEQAAARAPELSRARLYSDAAMRLRELEAVLGPLAQFARAILHDENKKDDHVIVGKVVRDPAGDWSGRVTFGDCRRALAAAEKT
jgi:hypothetical protein